MADYEGNEEVCAVVIIVDGKTPRINLVRGGDCITSARQLMMLELDDIHNAEEPPEVQRPPAPAGWVEVCTIENAWAGICWLPIIDEPPRYRVGGIVTWKGQPINGEIQFAGGEGGSLSLIKDGRYHVRTTAGVNRVSIEGATRNGSSIPAKYNVKSKLEFEVQTHHNNVFDITLPLK